MEAMTLTATETQLRAWEEYTRSGKITSNAYQYAVAKGYSEETLKKLRDGLKDKVRESRVSLAMQGDPLRYRKRETRLANPTDPTPEWLAKAGKRLITESAGRGEVIGAKLFKQRSLYEQYVDKIGMSKKDACIRWLQDASYADACDVAHLEPSGGGSPDQIGGIGDVPQYVRIGFARFQWVSKYLSEEALIHAKALITHEYTNPDGSAFTPEEYGEKIFADVKHLHRRWGLTMGTFKLLCAQLVHLYQLCPYDVGPIDDDERLADSSRRALAGEKR